MRAYLAILSLIVIAGVVSAWQAGQSTPSAAAAEASPASAASPNRPAIGEVVADFTFKDIHYLPRRLADLGERQAFVLVFTTLDCPLVKRYLPRLVELERELAPRGVQFLAINVGSEDTLREVAYQALRVEAPFPFGKDFDGSVAKAVGATRTPEVVVLDGERHLRYRGRIDDQFRLGGGRPEAAHEELKTALDEVLAGRPVTVAETPVDGCLISFAQPAPIKEPVNWAQHIAPLLQKHCQDCHHDAGTAPFALTSFEEASSHAASIAEVVAEERMPPWFASAEHGKFENHRGLSAAERRAVKAWVQQGCPAGDLANAPPPRQFSQERWRIGEPDLVLQSPKYKLPATGVVPYKYALLPYVFLKDTWVQGIEILPENVKALHHCNLAYVQAGERPSDRNFVTGQVPGGDAMQLREGIGFKIPGGSMLVLQIHHVPTGEESTDRISLGLVIAKEVIQKQLRHMLVKNTTFAIPPGDPNYRIASERQFPCDALGVGMFTHMHVRGKDMTFRARYPDKREETLLAVPNYNFDWQMPYVWGTAAPKFPRGTSIECVAHYDNSAFNPYNPDPKKTVREGQQTVDEMMYGYLFYIDEAEQLGIHVDPKTGHETGKPSP